jgi:hypothetical protein
MAVVDDEFYEAVFILVFTTVVYNFTCYVPQDDGSFEDFFLVQPHR